MPRQPRLDARLPAPVRLSLPGRRAGLVKNLKELDKYPWSGHSAILGRSKNPLIPEPAMSYRQSACPVKFEEYLTGAISSSDRGRKPIAEKTVEDVLGHFGDIIKVARKRYRHFVKQGISQGTRPELQGGGLVRSAGGDKRGLLGGKKEERDPPASPERAQTRDGGLGKGDERILGSGDFACPVKCLRLSISLG